MKKQIVVSQYGGYHGGCGAEAAYAVGMLGNFVTSYPHYVDVPQNLIRDTRYVTSILPYIARVLGKYFRSDSLVDLSVFLENHAKGLYERYCKRFINKDTAVFHSYSSPEKYCFKKCDELGIFKLIDWGGAHPQQSCDIIYEEFRLLGLGVKADIPTLVDDARINEIVKQLERADRVYVPSDFVLNSFATYGYKGKNIVKNRYGVDTGRFLPRYESKSRRTLRISTMVGIRKGTHYVLEAVKQLIQEGVSVELYLLGSPGRDYKHIVDQYADCITHMGGIIHHKLKDYYAASTVFVLPTLSEGMARGVLEAMACGTPVIVTPNSGYDSEIIKNGYNGFFVPIRNVDSIKDRLLIFYQDPAKAIEMGRNARQSALENQWRNYKNFLSQEYLSLSGRESS